MLCQYSNIFGEPGKGVHKYRVCNIAVVDVLLTIVGAYLINLYVETGFWKVLLCLFLLGIILHKVFCVRTTVNKFLFG